MIAARIDSSDVDAQLKKFINDFPEDVKNALGETADLAITVILDRTIKGFGLDGKFKPYSKRYAWIRKTTPPEAQTVFVDLTRSGDMIGSINVTKLTTKYAVISSDSTAEKMKVAGTNKDRRWFGLSDKERNKLVLFFRQHL
jgi:hypothetical protein